LYDILQVGLSDGSILTGKVYIGYSILFAGIFILKLYNQSFLYLYIAIHLYFLNLSFSLKLISISFHSRDKSDGIFHKSNLIRSHTCHKIISFFLSFSLYFVFIIKF